MAWVPSPDMALKEVQIAWVARVPPSKAQFTVASRGVGALDDTKLFA